MTTIQVFDAYGHAQAVSAKNLSFRPAVFGIFIEHNQILLLRDVATQLLMPPGRIVMDNEAPRQAVRHYFRELAGITPILGPLIFIENQYRQADGQFWQLSALYYVVERPSAASIHFPEDDQSGLQPEWLPVDDLTRTQFQFGYEAVKAGKLRL